MGDEGSGYMIGLKALKAIMKSYDGRAKNTILVNSILDYLNLKNIDELIEWSYRKPFKTVKIAALAKTVCKTAADGDEQSVKILKEEAEEAFFSVYAVAKKLNLINKKFDLVTVGSVFKCEEFFKSIFIRKINNELRNAYIKPLTEKPVRGAIKLALAEIGRNV